MGMGFVHYTGDDGVLRSIRRGWTNVACEDPFVRGAHRASVKERESRRVRAGVVPDRTKETLHGLIIDNVDPTATVYTDEAKSYKGIPNPHEWVNHSAGEYVRDMTHTNGIESFWNTLKKAY